MNSMDYFEMRGYLYTVKQDLAGSRHGLFKLFA